MTRCVVHFKDDTFANLEANVLSQESGFTVAYNCDNARDAVTRSGICGELIGKFRDEDLKSIYLSQKSESGKRA